MAVSVESEALPLTVADVATRLGVRKEMVLRLIGSGALLASNISCSPGRPTWRIAPDDLEQFLESRKNRPAGPEPEANCRRRDPEPETVRFFPE